LDAGYRAFDTGRRLEVQTPLPLAKKEGRPEAAFRSIMVMGFIAFSSESLSRTWIAGWRPASREENASKQESKARF
jgi:hypothetical protein